MQLQRLTHLERDKIVQEYKEIKEKYTDERRTEIRDEVITDIRPEDLIKEEDVVVMTTQSGYIKRTSLSSYHFQMRGGKGRRGISMKAEDIVEDVFVCSTHSYLLFLTNTGRVYWLKALEIPDVGVSGRGKAIVNLLELQPGETMTSVVAVKDFSEDKYIVMLATNGQIKKTHLSEFRNVRRGGIIAMSLRSKSQLMWSRLTDGKREIIIATRLGKVIRI
jgi:DNA gyrase subunit A